MPWGHSFNGIPKGAFRAFGLLHKLGEEIYAEKLGGGTVDICSKEERLPFSAAYGGKSDYLNAAQIHSIMTASYTKAEPIEVNCADGSCELELTVPAMGIALVTLFL